MEIVVLIILIMLTTILGLISIIYTAERKIKYDEISCSFLFCLIPIGLSIWLAIASSYPLKQYSEETFKLETVNCPSGISITFANSPKGLKNISEKYGAVYDDKKFVYKITKYESWYCGINFHESEYSRIEELK